MANGYGVRPRGYDGYGGGYRSTYQYRPQQSAAVQYQSFYDPVPVDFLTQNMAQHQQRYDQAFAGALAAKEAALQEEIALDDQIYRNELIGKSMQDMDKVAQEKYGGDYGRAAKEIARKVTELRSDPFWQSSKYLKEQQVAQQKFMLENPNAHLYTDVSKIGAANVDPETGEFLGIRSPEELTFEAQKKGDWQKSVEMQFADINPDTIAQTLADIGIEGYKGIKHIRQIKPEDLDTLLRERPQMVMAFMENNPDFVNSKSRLEGLTSDEIFNEAKNYIIGNISDKPFREEKLQAVKDWVLEDEMARARAGNPADGIVLGNASEFVELMVTNPNKVARNLKQTKSELNKMADGPQKKALQAQYDRDVANREFLINSVQTSPYAVDFDSYYEDYSKFVDEGRAAEGHKKLSREEFEDEVFNSVREGRESGTIKGKGSYQTPYGGGNISDNSMQQASLALIKGLKKLTDDGKISVNVNVLGGETGRQDVDTHVGRMNNELTDFWKRSNTSFSVPYSDMQIGDILENDKRYNGKKRNTLPRDPTKDQVLITDGTMAAKPVYQLNLYDENGKHLGSEFINPDNPTIAMGNAMNSATEMLSSGDPVKQKIGINMLNNHVFGPAIQAAEIHKNPQGGFGVAFAGSEIKYERVPGQVDAGYNLYIEGPNGEKDYFEDENGNIYNPKTEREIQQILIGATLAEQQNP